MPAYKVLGLTDAAVDPREKTIHFSLMLAGESPPTFVMDYGPAAQVTSGLGRMFLTLQEIAHSQKTGMAVVAAEQIKLANIHQEKWSGNVIFQITTPTGIPYSFVMPANVASDIADRLKTESAKPYQAPGTA